MKPEPRPAWRSTCTASWVFALVGMAGCSADAPTVRNPGTPMPGAGTGVGTAGVFSGGAAGGFGNPNMGVGARTGGAATGAGGSGPRNCADATVQTSIAEPDILFVVDGSGSMCAPFGGSTRWQSLRAALLDPMNGVIFRTQQTVNYGLMIYDGTIDPFLALTAVGGSPPEPCAGMYLEAKAMGMCPGLVQVPVALNNAMAIDTMFPATELGGSTPTDRAMNMAVDQMIGMRSNDPDGKPHPQYIILATDGQPNDICMGGVGGDGAAQKAGVIAAVDRAAMNNIITFVISLAGGDQGLQTHLDEVAKHGQPLNPMAITFAPDSPMGLVDTLTAIVGGAVGCEIALQGKVLVGSECRGKVKINGAELPCCTADATGAMKCNGMPADPANGWVLKDTSTIELVGTTCQEFLANPQALLTAGFPCDVIVM
ncbi:MAG TPA: hypothetical protein VK509_21275 [Polyangiales bacterium]|nr:hypothetical protein [Polyangiales bacterium]